jgi:rare lipoprotein A (peptidoglycan hydrolase)
MKLKILLVSILALSVAPNSLSASKSVLNNREDRQVASLHKYHGTVRFFDNHDRLARTFIGKRETRRAHVWIKIIGKELRETRSALHPKPTFSTKSMVEASASWYGPGLYGNGMACGGTLQTNTLGVAHKSLACGTMVTICYHSCIRVPVVDRGPYVTGREFDLTGATAWRLGLSGVQTIRYCVC